jgi:hypothetical protein
VCECVSVCVCESVCEKTSKEALVRSSALTLARTVTQVLANVNSATFAPFARVCGGAIGNKLLQPDHTILLVNSDLGESRDVGNLWVRALKALFSLSPV